MLPYTNENFQLSGQTVSTSIRPCRVLPSILCKGCLFLITIHSISMLFDLGRLREEKRLQDNESVFQPISLMEESPLGVIGDYAS